MTAYRQAALDDAAELHALLLAVAPEIPLAVEPLEREEELYVLVRNCARSGESWVAELDGHLVGFLLAEPNRQARHYAEHEVLELHYAGVMAEYRGQGVFAALVDKLLARLLPVTTTVPPHNRARFTERLERLGFRAVGAPGGEQRLRWDPGASA